MSYARCFAAALAAGLSLGTVAWAATGAPAASTAAPATGAGPRLDFTLTPVRIATACGRELARAKHDGAALATVPASRRTFSTVVVPLENVVADLNDRLVSEALLSSVARERAVRDASLACQNDVSDFLTELTARPALYAAVAAAKAGGTAASRADRKLTDLWLVSLKRSGAGLPAGRRATFVATSRRLTQIQNTFGANLGNDKTTINLSEAGVAGLGADFLATCTKTADGYIVPVNESTVGPFMQNAIDPEARKAFYFANYTIAPQNVALLHEAIALRDRLAHVLGYPNWGTYVLADRMAESPARVNAFLMQLDAKLLPRATANLERLAQLKARDRGALHATIEPWDVAFYDNRLRKTQYAVDSSEVRQYFPIAHVERAVFAIYAKILGVAFTERKNPVVWAPDVTQWSMHDAATGRYIGDFYLDLFPREGKYSHFASFPMLPNRRRSDGTMRPPLDAIIGNWPAAAPGKPALLSHDDVETFFHEFGHTMATLLATTPYESLSSGFRQDFVETPSQMLENWVWDPAILKALSSNVTTGAPLPDALIAKMRAARYVDEAYYTTRQIMLATIDMTYHTSGPSVDTTHVWSRVARAMTPLALPRGVHPESTFGHIMGGYDAGYYGYLWSKVYAQDMFTAFQAGGLESARVGARYRRDILGPARELEPDAEVHAFLGRAVSPAAFYREFDAAD